MSHYIKRTGDGQNYEEIGQSTQDSIELSQTAKGHWQATIKVYFESGHGNEAVGQARAYADSIKGHFNLVPEPPSVAPAYPRLEPKEAK